jgi:hypothetical protein
VWDAAGMNYPCFFFAQPRALHGGLAGVNARRRRIARYDHSCYLSGGGELRHLASSSASCRRSVGLKLSRYDVPGSQIRIPSGLLPGSWDLRPECRLALYGAKSFASHRMFCRFQAMSLRRIPNMVLFHSST